MYYGLGVAAVLFLLASIDDLHDGQVYDVWFYLLLLHVIILGDVGAVQVWFASMFAVFGYFLTVEGVWSMGDTLLFTVGSLYLSGFSMVAVYLATVVVGGALYSFVWEEYLDRSDSVRFVPVLAVAFVVSHLVLLV